LAKKSTKNKAKNRMILALFFSADERFPGTLIHIIYNRFMVFLLSPVCFAISLWFTPCLYSALKKAVEKLLGELKKTAEKPKTKAPRTPPQLKRGKQNLKKLCKGFFCENKACGFAL
jgi:hypothetical protein